LFPEGIATLKLKGAFEFHCIRLTWIALSHHA
jgi:hypothetical protein